MMSIVWQCKHIWSDPCAWGHVRSANLPQLIQGGPKKVSQFHELSLNRIKTRY